MPQRPSTTLTYQPFRIKISRSGRVSPSTAHHGPFDRMTEKSSNADKAPPSRSDVTFSSSKLSPSSFGANRNQSTTSPVFATETQCSCSPLRQYHYVPKHKKKKLKERESDTFALQDFTFWPPGLSICAAPLFAPSLLQNPTYAWFLSSHEKRTERISRKGTKKSGAQVPLALEVVINPERASVVGTGYFAFCAAVLLLHRPLLAFCSHLSKRKWSSSLPSRQGE